MRPSLGHLLLPVFFVAPIACGGSLDDMSESVEDALVTRVSGSAIPSAYVDPHATYFSARSIATLADVGALRGALASLAQRADGIIAAQPADGRVSTNELLRLEQPGFIQTLFPEEKAALPLFWKLMETVD